MKMFSTGKKYELQLKQSSQEFNEYFYKPKAFKTMKVFSYSESVFKTFLADYPSLVSVVENYSFVLRYQKPIFILLFDFLTFSKIYLIFQLKFSPVTN